MCKIMNAEIKKKEAKKKMGSLMIIAYEEEVTCCWVSRNFFFISNSIMLVVNKCFSIYNVYVRLLTQVRRLGYSALWLPRARCSICALFQTFLRQGMV